MGFMQKLKGLLEREGLSQAWLARRVGTTPYQVQRWFKPKVRQAFPTPDQLLSLARYFRTSVDFLVDDSRTLEDLEVDREEQRLLGKARLLGLGLSRERLEAAAAPPRVERIEVEVKAPGRAIARKKNG